ncbi:MAG: Glutamate N-acetyltransferase @ N-acetylglutamate synthase [uncultured Solirubrobacterales bacterium]|uniref:Arginine biosynthesis bifunctional protein ArgJ n=1 Tax=uncultured Solirubrobacterales bacterium TaxID=768556 RepID=A0A6J4SJE0_9ACTN|nr:MAG: Glutamate N-acetyltransferase @ N-acetylglutamate synthase [uncultured Solirubrobacterales bacterium]
MRRAPPPTGDLSAAAPAGDASSTTAAPSFFRSRWVERPTCARELEPGTLPRGFRAAGVAAGLKRTGKDVGVLVSDEPGTTSAARFTTNALVGAPVAVSAEGALDGLRAVVANSAYANVSDGERGMATARESQAVAAELLDLPAEQIGLASTGKIAVELPQERLVEGIATAVANLGTDGLGFSEAILTTDRGPKRAWVELALPSGTVRLAAQAKGAGMISPRFATMLCFVQTDAALDAETLDLLTGVCVKRSFDRISVDGQLSTSDTVYALASGASGVRVEQETEDELRFGQALDALLRQLALEIVADGEGASRVGRVVVRGGDELVEPVARAIADSPLVKTALHGADPNFGRILQAAGQALAGRAPFVVDLEIEGRRVASAGQEHELSPAEWAALEREVAGPEVEIELTVPGSGGETEVFFSDLTREYVSINADYST